MPLTADLAVEQQDGAIFVREYAAATGNAFHTGGTVNVNTGTGYAVVGADAANRRFLGIADETLTTTANGELIRLRCAGDFRYPATSITQAMVGSTMYVDDEGVMDDVAGVANFVTMGTLVRYISNTLGVVNILSPQTLTADGAAITFTTGAAPVKLAALASANVSAALDEIYTNVDAALCQDGDGVTTVAPPANRSMFAKAVAAVGAGVSYRVQADGAGITQRYLVACSADDAGDGVPIVTHADANVLGRQPDFYCPVAIVAGALGWAWRVYRQLNSGINTAASATGNPVFMSAVAGQSVLAAPATGAKLIIGKVLSTAADGEIEYLLPPVPATQFYITHAFTAGEDAANLADIDTGFGVNPVTVLVQVRSAAGADIATTGGIITIGTGGAGTIRIADGGGFVVTNTNVAHIWMSMY